MRLKIALFFLFPWAAFAQSSLLPLNNDVLGRYEKAFNEKDFNFHTSSKPYLLSHARLHSSFDSINASLYDTAFIPLSFLTHQHLLKGQKGQFLFTADPYLDVLPGYELGRGTRFESTFGANLNLSVTEKFHINTIVSQGFAEFPSFIDSIARMEEVVPGRGFAFERGNTLRFRNNSGYASYSPGKYINLQAGYGRNFIGDGYRSLLLSDNAYSYPYAKITTKIWKLQYVNLFTNFQDIGNSGGNPENYYNKYGAFHYLSWNITKRLNIGLFESIIFENRDTTGRRFTYDVNYLNPMIFYRPVEYAMGSADNALVGLNIKYNLFKKQVLYGQMMLDEFLLRELRADFAQAISPNPERQYGWWANKYGFQVGAKWFDFIWIKNLNLQLEHNLVRPYSYTHSSVYQNYGHYNQALAHPLGANFSESICILRYYYKRFSAETKFVYSRFGDDTEDVYYGRNIYRSYQERPYEHGHIIGQGIETSVLFSEFRLSYLLNPKYNLQLQAGAINRQMKQQGSPDQNSTFVFVGLRTSLFNWYYDR